LYNYEMISSQNKNDFYHQLNTHLKALTGDDNDLIAVLANASALLYMHLPDINWAGFYLYKNGELVLGPFQGKPACVRIPLGKGVCGTAALTRKIQLVNDVNLFPGHIACDSSSQSEIVLPIIRLNRLFGVLDIDSPVKSRFDNEDAEGLSQFIEILNMRINP